MQVKYTIIADVTKEPDGQLSEEAMQLFVDGIHEFIGEGESVEEGVTLAIDSEVEDNPFLFQVVAVDVAEHDDIEEAWMLALDEASQRASVRTKKELAYNVAIKQATDQFYSDPAHLDANGMFDIKKVGSNEKAQQGRFKAYIDAYVAADKETLDNATLKLAVVQNKLNRFKALLDQAHRTKSANIEADRLKLRRQELVIRNKELALRRSELANS